MTKERAIAAATEESKQHKVRIAVVDAPIENAEEESGPFGYVIAGGEKTLYRYGTVIGYAEPNGEFTATSTESKAS